VDERKLPEAEAALREALEVHRKFSDQQQSPLFAYALTTMAGILNQQGKYYEAEDALRQAWLIQQKALGEEHPDTIRTRSQLIGVLKKEGKTTLAGTTLRKPTASDQTPKDNTVFDYQNSLETLGEALHREGKLPEAEAFLREALAAYRKFPDQQRQKQLSWVLISLAAVLKEQGRAEEAEPLLRESVAIYRALGNTTAIEYEDTLRSLGETLLSRKKLPEAESFLREAIAVHRNASGRQPSPRLAWALISLADLLVQQGKDKDAEQMLLEAVTIERKALGDQHPDTTRTLDSLMNLLRQEGKTNEANALVAGQTNIVTESRSEAR
jgi:tetratricopeptide (TPR) repeat protein